MKFQETKLNTFLKKGVNHHFFTNDFYFAIAYIVLASIFLLLSIASIVAVQQSKFIILGGLVPTTVMIVVPLTFLLIANIADYKNEIYKSWRFWLIVAILLVHLVGIPVVWSILVPDYTTFADHYKNWNEVNQNNGVVVDKLVDSTLMNEVRIGLWFFIIFTFMTFVLAIVLMIFAWKDKYDNKNIITDDKLVQEFIDQNKGEVEFESISDNSNSASQQD